MKTMLLLPLLAVGMVGCTDTPIGETCFNSQRYTIMERHIGVNAEYKWLAHWKSPEGKPSPCKEQQP